jgi:hypothetical protein
MVSQLVKKFPAFYGTEKVHYLVNNSSPLVPVPNQINPVHATLPSSLEINFNITLPPIPRRHILPEYEVKFRKPVRLAVTASRTINTNNA